MARRIMCKYCLFSVNDSQRREWKKSNHVTHIEVIWCLQVRLYFVLIAMLLAKACANLSKAQEADEMRL